MRYVIYGAGGIGAGVGAQLFAHGHAVVLIARGPHLKRLRSAGLTLRTPDGTTRLQIPAVGHPAEIDFGDDDVVILAMKSQDTAAALVELRAVASAALPIVAAQNGVANERMACRRFHRVYAMLVWMPATFLEPGVVSLHATPVRGVLDAGCYPRGVDGVVAQVCAELTAAGFSSRPEPDIMPLKYANLLTNLGNALQALCGLEADLKPLARALSAEAKACYEAAGIDYRTVLEMLAHCSRGMAMDEIDGEPRGGGSTWQSVMRGQRSLETDYLNGEIVLLGATHGVATPLNRAVLDLTWQVARQGWPPGRLSVAEVEQHARRYSAEPESRRAALPSR